MKEIRGEIVVYQNSHIMREKEARDHLMIRIGFALEGIKSIPARTLACATGVYVSISFS